MSKLKEKIGEEKYNQVLEILKDTGIKDSEFDLLDGFMPRARYNEIKDKLKATEDKILSYETQLTETKKLLDTNEDFKTKYSELEIKFNTELESKNKEIDNVLKKSLIKENLINAGAKHIDLLMSQINMDTVKIDNEKLFGFDEQLNNIKTSYADLFTTTENKQDVKQGQNNDSGTGIDLSFMDNL